MNLRSFDPEPTSRSEQLKFVHCIFGRHNDFHIYSTSSQSSLKVHSYTSLALELSSNRINAYRPFTMVATYTIAGQKVGSHVVCPSQHPNGHRPPRQSRSVLCQRNICFTSFGIPGYIVLQWFATNVNTARNGHTRYLIRRLIPGNARRRRQEQAARRSQATTSNPSEQ